MYGLTAQRWLTRYVYGITGHIVVSHGLFGQNYVFMLALRAHEEGVSFLPLLRQRQTDSLAHQDIRYTGKH